eukprot:CAMPEP_0113627302 /NCGR_PEP_ID=MMETSP0017_2-20120614/14133_1 /TAXON_ID=2856 /ORGANISM="Cylindrotheca closterium" /LENGTH=283 /DNA_ID=CAMNT_0000537539 /DNA_START=231 /DNA_END=1079 /DNA_ORIENTATION=- /assembly_acc=CAM_ASM_000147
MYRSPTHLHLNATYGDTSLKSPQNRPLIDFAFNSRNYTGCSNWTATDEAFCSGHSCRNAKPLGISNEPLSDPIGSGCKTLWFAGFSICDDANCKDGGYISDYAVALLSAIQNANHILQPVLLVGRYGCTNEEMPPIVDLAASKGAIVVIVDELSFQQVISSHLARNESFKLSMGPYLRLEIPALIKRHRLTSDHGICKEHVLYTDSDVMFVNTIHPADLAQLKGLSSYPSDAYVVYGRESNITGEPKNTGVMMIDILRFEQEWPSILEFGIHNGPFSAFDQGW